MHDHAVWLLCCSYCLLYYSDWCPAPTALHIVEDNQLTIRSSSGSGYPRHRYGSLPRSSSSQSMPHTATLPHSIKYAATPPHHNPDQHSRSITSPEAQHGNQSRPPLLRGHSTGVLQHSAYPAQHAHNGRSLTLNRYQAGKPSAPPPLRVGSAANPQWDSRGQSSQPDGNRSYETWSVDYYSGGEHNLSDSTQTSTISEPAYQKPK
jgi:hypothetical protein